MPPVNSPKGSATDSSAAAAPGGFSMDGFMSDLAAQNTLRDQRQTEQLAVAEEQRNIMQQSTQLSQKQADSMSFLKTDFDIARQKTEHARSLEDGGLFDNLRLAGLQMLDPAGYDPAERTKRLQEDSAQAALLSQYYGYQQGALQSKLQSSTANLDVLKQLEAIGHEKLTAFADSAALIHQNVSAMQTMKDDATSNLTPEQIAAAISQAQKSPTKSANIGGVEVDLGSLTDRQSALYDRQSANLTKQAGLQIAQYDAAHVNDVLANKEAQAQIDANTRKNVPNTIAIQNAQQVELGHKLIEDGQRRDLQTRNLTELKQLRDNNYKSPAGEQFDPKTVEDQIGFRNTVIQDQVNEAVNKHMLDSFDTKQLADERTQLQGNMQKFTPGTPLAAAAQKYYQQLGVTATGIGPENGLTTRLVAVDGFAKAKDQYEASLKQQAVLDAKGDKNVEELRYAYYRGNPVPQETLANAAVDRLTKFKSVADIFPSDVAPKIEKKYRELIQQKTQRGLMDPTLSAEDKKIAQVDSANDAIEWGVQQGLQGSSDAINAQQVTDPSHPLFNRQTPTQMLALNAQADFKARQEWQQQYKLTDAEASQVEAGIPLTGKDRPDIGTLIQARKTLENVNLLQLLDGIEPGLGHQVADWWSSKGQTYISNIGDGITKRAGNSFQSNNFTTQAGKTLSDSYAQYGAGLQQADGVYQGELVKRNTDLLTFGNDPQAMQVTILAKMPGLADTERKQIMSTVVQPILDQAKAKGLDFDGTNQYVESQIQNYVPQTPMMKELMRITRKDRQGVLQELNSWQGMFSRWTGMTPKQINDNFTELPSWAGLKRDTANGPLGMLWRSLPNDLTRPIGDLKK